MVNCESNQPGRLQSKPVIGLSGGIASGKSTVAGLLAELGAAAINYDALVAEELKTAEVIDTSRGWWGERVLTSDGGINREALADIFFEDPSQRRRMERFLYPRLDRTRIKLMREFALDLGVSAVVIDAPLLYEAGLEEHCDVVVFVECPRAVRLRRAADTRGWSEQEFDRREKLQKPLDIKKQSADYTVENNSSADVLRSQVANFFHRLTSTDL